MSGLQLVLQEVAELLSRHGPFVRGNTPNIEITLLYKEYFRLRKEENAQLKTVEIQKDFAGLFGKKAFWSNTYGQLARLHPKLLEKIRRRSDVKKGEFYLSIAVALQLACNPQDIQEWVLEEATKRSKGRVSKVWVQVCNISRELWEKDKAKSPYVPVTAAKGLPAPATTKNQKPEPIAQEPKTADDLRFLDFLAKTPWTKPRNVVQ